MKKRLAIVKIIGAEAHAVGTAVLSAEFKKAKGIPADAKELRRYRDVVYGQEAIGIVFEHSSFPEVEDGGLIPGIPVPKEVKEPDKPATNTDKNQTDKTK